jgi:tetratricopeptide (TPR) repeat protein
MDRAERTSEAVADAHVGLARWCFKQGMNVAGREQLQHALKLVPEFDKAMKELGYRQKRVDGKKTWVLDKRAAPPETDSADVTPDDRDAYLKEREKLNHDAAVEYVKLGRYAEKLELKTEARVSFETAIKYDPLNEDALKGAGWVKDDVGEWISPREAADRKETAEALSSAPTGEPVDELPDWAAQVFKTSAPLEMTFGPISVLGSGSEQQVAGKYAHAASTLTAGILGGKVGELRVVLAADKAEHKQYCQTRQAGVAGLQDSNWVLGENEVEVRLDAKDEKLGMERVVYAVAVFEVRRRCGDTTHPWFEIGFASNLTRRLLGRVDCTEFSGDASGPTEAGRWKRTFRMLLADDEQPKVGKLVVERDPDEKQAMLAHFFVRYLCGERRAALPDFCKAMKSTDDAEGALKSAFAEGSAKLDELFVDWFERN